MKYIKVTSGSILWQKENITKEDLVQVVNRVVDTIINTEDMTYYDGELNAWHPIPGDKL